MSAKLSEETVRALLAKKNWEPVEGWEYLNRETQIPGRCIVCGYESGPDKGPRYYSLQQGQGACKRCGGIEKISSEVVRALLAEKDWEPVEGWEYADVKTPIPGRCLVEGCGYKSEPDKGPTYKDLRKGQGACRRCAGNEPLSEEVVRAFLAEKNWEPIPEWKYINSSSPIPGRCLVCDYESGPEDGPNYNNLHQGHNACQSCADGGYNPLMPGAFYRFEFAHKGEMFLCYGISNLVNTRRKHYERQIEVKNFQSLHFEDGAIPQKLEKQFHEIRKKSSAPASACGVNGTVAESFSLAPDHWELLTVFEAHWQAARSVPIGKS